MSERLKVAIVQDFPLPFAVSEGMERVVQHTRKAIETGARIIAFGEHFLGGAPSWLSHLPPAMLWDHPGTRDLHATLLRQALRGEDPRFQQLQWAADIAGVVVSVGGIERVRDSLYSTQFLFRPKAPVLRHRKLALAPGEQLLFGSGDGSTLDVHESAWGAIGQLAASEHWMPLARAAMHQAREAVHIAAWPALNDHAMLASAHYAYEGGCFVLSAGTLQSRHDLTHGYARAGGEGRGGELLARLPEALLQNGHSAIVAPDGVVIAQAGDQPTILTAEIDLGDLDRARGLSEPGAAARPDVFEMRIDRRQRETIVDVADDASAAA